MRRKKGLKKGTGLKCGGVEVDAVTEDIVMHRKKRTVWGTETEKEKTRE